MGRSEGLWKLQLRATCAHCNGGIPINGPLRVAQCANCLSEQDVSRFWRGLVESLADRDGRDGGGVTINFTDHYTFERTSPACPECDAPVDEAAVATDADRAWECAACGARLETYPAPEWLKAIDAAFAQVCFGVREEPPEGAEAAAMADAPEPVVMACPKCGAGLELGSDAERATRCRFCEARVYIPDELWRILHPVPTMKPWYLGLEGETRPERMERVEREREQAEQVRRRQREKAERRRELEREQARKRLFVRVTLGLLLGAVLLGLAVALVTRAGG